MIYYVIKQYNEVITGRTFSDYSEMFAATFEPLPDNEVSIVIDFTVRGVDYHEAKANARQIAIDTFYNIAPDLSYSEICDIAAELERLGKRYGLLKEFRENGLI